MSKNNKKKKKEEEPIPPYDQTQVELSGRMNPKQMDPVQPGPLFLTTAAGTIRQDFNQAQLSWSAQETRTRLAKELIYESLSPSSSSSSYELIIPVRLRATSTSLSSSSSSSH
jgi:hypothetical protein